jgi:F-type H+-transporting ATPase subunit delta
MTTPRKARRIARALFRGSFTDGRLDEAKVRQAMQQLAASQPRMLVAIFKSYGRLVRLEVERNTGRVESAAELDGPLRGRLMAQLQRIYGRPVAAEFQVNPGLIGGVRVRIGSDVWDGSVSGRLRELSAAL